MISSRLRVRGFQKLLLNGGHLFQFRQYPHQSRVDPIKSNNLLYLTNPMSMTPEERFTAVRQHGSIDGVINRIGGKDETIHVSLEMDGKQISGCYTNRAVAKELRHHLFDTVRLHGRGKWNRDGDGNWSLKDFKIESFEALKEVPLSQALAELRSIPTEWIDESHDELRVIRHGPLPNG